MQDGINVLLFLTPQSEELKMAEFCAASKRINKVYKSSDYEDLTNLLQQNRIHCFVVNFNFYQQFSSLYFTKIKQLGKRQPIILLDYGDFKVYEDPFFKQEIFYAQAAPFRHLETFENILRSAVLYWISERKKAQIQKQLFKAENRLANIISNTPIVIFVLDIEGRFKLGLGKYWEIFGKSVDEIIGRNYQEVFYQSEQFDSAFRQSLTQGFANCTLFLNGRFFEINLNLIQNADSKRNEVLALANDVSHRVEAEKSLKKAAKMAKKTSKIKQEFIANMSHEIRTPLNAIIGFTELINNTNLSKDQKEFIEAIKLSSDNLLNMMNSILDFSKVESGTVKVQNKIFIPFKTVESVIKIQRGKANKKGISLSLEGDQISQNSFTGDERMYYQIVMNLVSNAVKFTTKGGVKVFLKVFTRNDGKTILSTSVQDTGIGIPKDDLSNVFKSFTQVNAQNHSTFEGTGLGLSIVKSLINLLNGEIDLSSEEGKGSTFTVYLPFKTSDTQVQTPKAYQSFNQNQVAIALNKIKILSVEDNEINQKLLELIFKSFDVQFDKSYNGEDAIRKLKDGATYDLILMDLQMPKKDGFETAKLIKKNPNYSAVPILALSANDTIKISTLKAKGIDAFIVKPIDKKLLLNTVVKLLKGVDLSDFEQPKEEEDALVDFSYLNNIVEGDNQGVLKEMLFLFQKESDDFKVFLNTQKICTKDADLIHKFKSTCSILGLSKVKKQLLLLEDLIDKACEDEHKKTLRSNLLDEIQALKKDLLLLLEKSTQKLLNVYVNN